MWTPIVLTLLVAFAAAENAWKPGSEYRFNIRSRTLTALHEVSDQYAGIIMRAQLTVQPQSDKKLVAQVSQAQYAQVETKLPSGWGSPIPEEQLQFKSLQLTNQPFEIQLNKGVIEGLIVSEEVPTWELNVLRSIVSQLQVDAQGEKLIKSKLNSLPQGNENNGVWKSMEKTVTGKCEVLYDVTPLPQYVLADSPQLVPQPQLAGQGEIIDIVKTQNYSNCQSRPGYNFGLNGFTDWETGTNDMGSFLSRSSTSRVVISGSLKSFTIQSSVTTNKIIVSPTPYDQQKGMVVSRMNLTLEAVQAVSQQIQVPSHQKSEVDVVYTYNPSQETENRMRQYHQQQREENVSSSSSSSSSSSESAENHISHGQRNRRSAVSQERDNDIQKIQKRTHYSSSQGSSSSSSDSSTSSSEEVYQPRPKMNEAPNSPFLELSVGYKGRAIQFSQVDPQQTILSLASQIGQELQNADQIPKAATLEKFLLMTRTIRTMKSSDLENVAHELYSRNKDSSSFSPKTAAWQAFRDAVSQAGTGPALMVIKNWIKNHQVKGEEAAQIVSVLPQSAHFPTAEYIQALFELVKSQEVTQQRGLNSSAIIAFSHLVRMAQVSSSTAHNRYPVHVFGPLSTKKEKVAVTAEYIPYLQQQLELAYRQQDSPKIQLYIRALGNVADSKILEVFEPYLEGKYPMTDYQRTLIVVSLNKLAREHPKLARSVFYKVLVNQGEAYQVRVAAVYQLMKTNPPSSMLQRLAHLTHSDASQQVRAVVKSAIESAAALSTKENAQLRHSAQAAVHLLTPEIFGLHYSHQNLTDYLIKGLDQSWTQSMNYIGSQDSKMPQALFYHLHSQRYGMKSFDYKIGGMVSSIELLVDLIEDQFEPRQQQQNQQQQHQRQWTLEKIWDILKPETEMKQQLEGSLLIDWLNGERFFTFDNHTIEQIPQVLRSLAQELQNGKQMNYQKMYNKQSLTIGFPTATGLPFVYKLKKPTVVSVHGQVQLNSKPETSQSQSGLFRIPDSIQASIKLQALYSTRTQAKISFITPFDHQAYLSGVDRNFQLNAPLNAHINIDIEKRQVKVEWKPSEESQEQKLVHYSVWPYVSQYDILSMKPISLSEKTQQIQSSVQDYKMPFGQQSTGLVFQLRVRSDRKFQDFKQFYDQFNAHESLSGLLYQPTIQHDYIDLTWSPSQSSAKSVSLSASWTTSSRPQKSQQETSQENVEYQQVQRISQQAITELVASANQDKQRRQQEFLKQVRQGIQQSQGIAVDLSAEFHGAQQAKYILTVAGAKNPQDTQNRYLAFFHQSPIDQQQYQVLYESEIDMPNAQESEMDQVSAKNEAQVAAYLAFGTQIQNAAQVSLQGKLQTSEQRRQYIRNEAQKSQKYQQEIREQNYYLPQSDNFTYQANLMDQYRFTIKYENIPQTIKNMTYKAYSVVRHLGWPYMSENPINGSNQEQNKIHVDVNFAYDLQSVNVSMFTPAGDAQFKNVRLNQYPRDLIVAHPNRSPLQRVGYSVLRQQYDSYATVDKTMAKTFNGKVYPIALGKVWHVMMLTNPRESVDEQQQQQQQQRTQRQVAVLVRDDESSRKEVQVIFRQNTIEIKPASNSKSQKALVYYNGQEARLSPERATQFKDEEGEISAIIYTLPNGEVRVKIPQEDLVLMHDGTRVKLTAGQRYMDQVYGLAGTYNGEKMTDFTTPQQNILHRPEEFAASWALSNEGKVAELKQRIHHQPESYKHVQYTNVIGEQDKGRADSRGRSYDNQQIRHYDSGSSSSSSSSSESQEQNQPQLKQLKQNSAHGCAAHRIQVVEKEGKQCFSLEPQPACHHKCTVESTERKTAKFFCVKKSAVSEHWARQVARGANPGFGNKGQDQEMEYDSPLKCSRN